MRLKSSNIFAPPLEWNMGLMSFALFARELPTFRSADCDQRQVGIDGQFLKNFPAVKHSRTSLKAGRRRSGLVDAVEPVASS